MGSKAFDIPPEPLGEQFDDLAQQSSAYHLGMWFFLASEVMLFGGLFLAYSVGRGTHSLEFAASSHHLNVALGAVNTVVLLTSSTTVAMAVESGEKGDWKRVARLLALTALLGSVFLCIKGYEWHDEWQHGRIPTDAFQGTAGERMFFFFYFVLTGLHAVHLSLGVAMMALFAYGSHRGWRLLARESSPLGLLGLYWHLVDLLWFYLYPLLYLVGERL